MQSYKKHSKGKKKCEERMKEGNRRILTFSSKKEGRFSSVSVFTSSGSSIPGRELDVNVWILDRSLMVNSDKEGSSIEFPLKL